MPDGAVAAAFQLAVRDDQRAVGAFDVLACTLAVAADRQLRELVLPPALCRAQLAGRLDMNAMLDPESDGSVERSAVSLDSLPARAESQGRCYRSDSTAARA